MSSLRSSKLSQYYTESALWDSLIGEIQQSLTEEFGDEKYQVIDPCAGDGYLIRTYFPGGKMFDVDPQHPDVIRADMTHLNYSKFGPNCAVVTNQPFNASCHPMRLINQALRHTNIRILIDILPEKYEQYPIDSRAGGEELNKYFHLVKSVPIDNSQFFNHMSEDGTGLASKLTTKLSLQTWVRRDHYRIDPSDEMDFVAGLPSHLENPELVVVLPNNSFACEFEGKTKGLNGCKGRKGRKGCKGRKGRKGCKSKSPMSFNCGNDGLGSGRSRVSIRFHEKARYSLEEKKRMVEMMAVEIFRRYTKSPQNFGPGYFYTVARQLKVLQRPSRSSVCMDETQDSQ